MIRSDVVAALVDGRYSPSVVAPSTLAEFDSGLDFSMKLVLRSGEAYSPNRLSQFFGQY